MNRRAWLATAAIIVLGLCNVVVVALLVNDKTRPGSSASDLSLRPAEQSASAGDDRQGDVEPRRDHVDVEPRRDSEQGSSGRVGIEVTAAAETVRSGETVGITGRYAGGEAGTRLVVQRRSTGRWKNFPLPTVLFPSRTFETYIQLTAPGRYWVRVVDPDTGESSNAVSLRVRAIDT